MFSKTLYLKEARALAGIGLKYVAPVLWPLLCASQALSQTSTFSSAALKFTDVTNAAGIRRETAGMRAVFVDFDSDGWLDLLRINRHYQPCLLYHNRRDSTFEDITEASRLRLRFNHAGTIWVDLDNDGDKDCLSAGENQDEYFINNGVQAEGSVTFTSRGSLFGTPSTGRHTNLAMADFDNDGLVDIFATQNDLDPHPSPADCALLLRNQGQGKFADTNRAAGLPDLSDVGRAFWTDLNHDNWPDLILFDNSRLMLRVFLNSRPGKFQEATSEAGCGNIGFEAEGPSYLEIMDLNDDGWIELVIDKPPRCYSYQNGRFVPVPRSRFFPTAFSSRLITLEARADFDNDGYSDLISSSEDGVVRIWRGRAHHQYEEIATPIHAWSAELSYSAPSEGDYDNDGDLDLMLVVPGDCALYRNDNPAKNWLKMQLRGVASNADGLGSRVELVAKSMRRTLEVSAGQRLGDRISGEIHFGLGNNAQVDSLCIHWPSGQVQRLHHIQANQRLVITEPMITNFEEIGAAAGVASPTQSKGGAFGDYDNDGYLDLVVNGGHSMLFHNNHDLTFTDVAKECGLYTTRWTHNGGVAWGDFNNDGWLDLFFTHESKVLHRLFLNQAGGSFVDVTTQAGVALPGNGGTVLLADFDANGFLDVLIPTAEPVQLFLNQGNATFVEAGERAGLVNIPPVKHRVGCTADYDNDGDIDVFLSSSKWSCRKHDAPNYLFRNRGNATFEDVTLQSGVTDSTNSKGAVFGDYDNDGDLDLYVTDDCGHNGLYHNNGDGTFTNVAKEAGVYGPVVAHSPAFGDMDNDGDLDLYVAGGSYVRDSLEIVYSLLPDVLYRNNGFDSTRGWTFTEITSEAGIENLAHCNTPLWGDIDNDGDLDLFLGNVYDKRLGTPKIQAPPYPEDKLYLNLGNNNHYLHLNLAGHRSNRAGIGARIEAYAGDLRQVREVEGGSIYNSQNAVRVAFGFGQREKIDKVIIRWPSGIVQTLKNPGLDRILRIEEPFTAGPVQIERTTLAQLQWWALRITGTVIALSLLMLGWKVWLPALRKRLSQRTLARTFPVGKPSADVLIRPQPRPQLPVAMPLEAQPAYLKASVNLVEFKNDFLLTHALEQTRNVGREFSDVHLGRQEKQPYVLRAEKIRHLKLDLDEVFRAYEAHVLHGRKPEISPVEALRDIGYRLYRFFGMGGFFARLFALPEQKPVHLEFVLDSLLVPWHFTFDESSKRFLFERFPYAISFASYRAPASGFRGMEEYLVQAPVALLFWGDWRGDRKELREVPIEVHEVEKVLRQAGIETHQVYQNLDQFAETILQMERQRRDLRLIHYCGHVEGRKLAAGEEDYLAPGFLKETLGLALHSNPIVFLNGCHSGSISNIWNRQENLATEFLECGASACLVTDFPVHETGARHFAGRFYLHFAHGAATAGEALRCTRLELGQRQHSGGCDPEYDVTRYFYNLYGDPTARL